MQISRGFHCSTLSYKTNRKIETMFRPKFSVKCFANWPFKSLWLSCTWTGKLTAYGLEISTVRLNVDYLTNRNQWTKIDCHYSSWKELLFRVSQRPILVSLLFSIYLCKLFLLTKNIDIANYADDTTPYVYRREYKLKLDLRVNEESVLTYYFISSVPIIWWRMKICIIFN